MADNELIAATLAAGMLRKIVPPEMGPDGVIEKDEQTRFVTDVLHAVGLYRAVLESLSNQQNARRVRLAGDEFVNSRRVDPAATHFATTADQSIEVDFAGARRGGGIR